MSKDKDKVVAPPSFRWGLFAMGCAAVMAICLAFPWLATWVRWAIPPEGVPHKANEVGDMFGALNTFFTGLAFVGLVVTILMQRQELREAQARHEKEMALQISENERLKIEEEDRKRRENVRFAEEMVFKYYEALQKAKVYYDIRAKACDLPDFDEIAFALKDVLPGVKKLLEEHEDSAVPFHQGQSALTSFVLSRFIDVSILCMPWIDTWKAWQNFSSEYLNPSDKKRLIDRLWYMLSYYEKETGKVILYICNNYSLLPKCEHYTSIIDFYGAEIRLVKLLIQHPSTTPENIIQFFQERWVRET